MHIHRNEIVGREGGEPPILISYWRGEELVGVYQLDRLEQHPTTFGPMFETRT